MKKHPGELKNANKKASCFVLAVAAVLFLATAFWIHSQNILNGIEEHFTAYGDGMVEFEKGIVREILSKEMKQEEEADGAWQGNQELSVVIRSGRYKGEIMTANNYFGSIYGVPLEEGDGSS